jgi:hypothetical protein
MPDSKTKINIICLQSLFGIIVLICGLLFCHCHQIANNPSNNNKKNLTEKTSLEYDATICIAIQFDNCQSRWISNKDKFRILNFNEIQFLENKKAEQRINLLGYKRIISSSIPISFIQHHLSPQEADELPILN